MEFEFATAGRVIFGEGKRSMIPEMGRRYGKRGFIVCGNDSTRVTWLTESLEKVGVHSTVFSVFGEPTIALAEKGANEARQVNAQFVIGVGGGSAIDAAKAIAALTTNPGDSIDYLEVIGKSRLLGASPLPVIAVPTTAGTGSEVTRNAVLASPEHKVKVSLRSAKMLPEVALVDPELTYDLPPRVTAFTGLDALTQLIEPFLSAKANPFTDGLCQEALPKVARALPAAFRNGADREARQMMALGSLFGGMALANAGLGAVHGFAAPIGGMFNAPHGAVCAALLPSALRVNLRAVRERGSVGTLARFQRLGGLLIGKEDAEEVVRWVEELCAELQVPPLRTYGIQPENFDSLCERAAKASSMKANPIPLTDAELHEILQLAV
jgi:alcohol dehydrogenase class IV